MASMGTGGRSGTSDAERSNRLNQDTGALPRDMATDALGEPVGVINVRTFETTEPTPAGTTSLEQPTQPGWFRWWHVPAATLPLAAGATATILLLRRRRKQVPISTYNRLVTQGRSWLNQALNKRATQSAVTSLQQSVTSMRGSAQRVPETAAALRDRSAELLAVAAATLAASAPVRQASGSAQGTLDAMTRFWNSRTPEAWQVKRATTAKRGTFTARLNGVRLGLMGAFSNMGAEQQLAAARASVMRNAGRAGRSVRGATRISRISKPSGAATKSGAIRSPSSSSAKASRAARRASKRTNKAFDRTRAFTFGMFVAAMLTYIRVWRQRLLEPERRETAGGRLVHNA